METQYQTNSDDFQLPVKQVKNRIEKLKELFMRLKKAHQYYKLYSNDPIERQQVIDGSEGLIIELEQLGVHKTFSEALLFFGKEFIDFEFGEMETEKIIVKQRNNNDEDIVSKAEEIFGVKAKQMTLEEIKIHKQVVDRAIAYTIKNGKPEILLYKTLQKGGYPSSVAYDKKTM